MTVGVRVSEVLDGDGAAKEPVEAWADPAKPAPDASKYLSPAGLLSNFSAYLTGSARFYKDHPAALKDELLSGITISILKVPESVAFAFVAGVHPLQGLYGSFFMGIITALLGGRPGMISGCAGALAVVIKVVMEDSGPFGSFCPDKRREYLFFVMVLTGILQLVCGALGCAKLVRLIPKTAFLGFFNGLAVVIFMSQLETFQKQNSSAPVLAAGNGTAACAATDFGFQADKQWYTLSEGTTWLMLLHIVIVMAIMELLPLVPSIPLGEKYGKLKPSRIMPPSLLGILAVMGLEHFVMRNCGVSTPLVRDVSAIEGSLPPWHIPDVPWGEWATWRNSLPVAASLCAIGLVESVLTLQAVDQILDQQTPVLQKNQECLAQGLANLASGFFMAMGGDAMIGQSTINVLNGAKGRLSAATDASFLMLYILLFSDFIEAVPTAGLAGILFIVVLHTFNWASISIIVRRALPLYMCATIVIVTVLSVLTNLAIGIGVGILWECVFFVWNHSNGLDVRPSEAQGEKKYHVMGDLLFANTDSFNSFFMPADDPDDVVVDFSNSSLIDFSALFGLNTLARRYELVGKKMIVELREDDYKRYSVMCDEPGAGGDDALRRFFKTHVCASLEGGVRQRAMAPPVPRGFEADAKEDP